MIRTNGFLSRHGMAVGFGVGLFLAGATGVAFATTAPSFQANSTLTSKALNDAFSQLQAQIDAQKAQLDAQSVPAGTIVAWGGEGTRGKPAPDGWLPCDGSELDGTNAKFAGLYAAIGTAYGGNTTSSKFNLPDLRGRFLRGWTNGAPGALRDPDVATRSASVTGGNVGDHVGTLQPSATRMPIVPFSTGTAGSHSHSFYPPRIVWESGTGMGYQSNSGAQRGLADGAVGAAGDHTHPITGGDAESRPANVSVNYIIRL